MSDWQAFVDEPMKLEEFFMAAAEGEAGRLAGLNAFLKAVDPQAYGDWPAAVKEAWNGGAELLLDTLTEDAWQAEILTWLKATAASGYDSAVFRDALAAGVRAAFPDYLDPAGLISAIGIHDPSVPSARIADRWRRFDCLVEGVRCCHPAYGAGVVDEIDPLTSEVHATFDRSQTLPLDVFLDTVQLVREPSLLERLLSKRKTTADGDLGNVLDELAKSLVPPGGDTRFFRRCLVPATMSEREFAKFVAETGEAQAETAGDETGGRRVAEARSAQELLEILKGVREFQANEADIATIDRLLLACGGKLEQAEILRDIIVRLWHLAPGAAWLEQSLKHDLADAAAWREPALFVKLTDDASGRAVADWLSAVAIAVGERRFFQLTIGLPLRLWAVVEQVVASLELDIERLVAAVVAALKSSDPTADMTLWLWRSSTPEKKLLRDVTLLIKPLGIPVKGPFLRAHRELRKLVVTDESLHRFLVEDRTAENAQALVRAIEHSAVLDSGERQSMLVRLVRTFPELRAIVEKRTTVVKRKAIPRMTSIRSYENRRLELTEIVNLRIPANSRAIATAREHGDLRENAEFKAAKDEQAYLSARRNELEVDLDEVRAYDFSQTRQTEQVVPGVGFELELSDGRHRSYHLLGLWDSDPERNMLSYETPLGAAVIGARPGDEIDLPDGETATLVAISPLPEDILAWLNETPE